MAFAQESEPSDRLFTERLALRPLETADAPFIAAFLSDWEVIKQTAALPHPYDERTALTWVARVRRRHAAGTQYAFATTLRGEDRLIGVVSLALMEADGNVFGEVGYWLGRPHWNQGYASEAVSAITDFAFDTLGLGRVEAVTFKENEASARVLAKLGFRLERAEKRNYPDRGGKRHILIYAMRREERAS